MNQQIPPSAASAPTTLVLDLSGVQPTSAALREVVVTLGQRLRGGVLGDFKVVIATSDAAIAEMIELLAREHELPLFLADSPADADVREARAVGPLTQVELETLNELHAIGGGATVAALAGAIGMKASAINNRLSSLERKGYLYRIQRDRRRGDFFVDPRVSDSDVTLDAVYRRDVSPRKMALLEHGIRSDPYDRSKLVLHGEAAERAAEILRRHGKLD
jgi:DNA-binding MarR family transcriptional regulator